MGNILHVEVHRTEDPVFRASTVVITTTRTIAAHLLVGQEAGSGEGVAVLALVLVPVPVDRADLRMVQAPIITVLL